MTTEEIIRKARDQLENLVGSDDPDYVHDSVDLALEPLVKLIQELRKDSSRLNWMAQTGAEISIGMRTGCKCGSCQAWQVENEKGAKGEDEFSLREAIDKAMSNAQR